MERIMYAVLFAAGAAAGAEPAFAAGPGAKVMSLVSGEVMSLVLSAAAVVIAGATGVLFARVARTFRETGEFLSTLGAAIEDRRVTREELAAAVREAKDILTIWK